jgi:biotin transport system substrate-specific component
MTALAPSAPRTLVLADRVFPRHLVVDITLVVLGAALTAGLAQISIPLQPVPITGQTLAVLLVGATLGAVRGGLSLAVYAAAGLIGLPVFAPEDDGSHITGTAAFLGSSGGYIVGFIFAAAFVGWLSQREWDRKVFKAIATFLGGTLVVFAFGLPWLAFVTGAGVEQTLEWGLYPFILGGIIKAAIAALLLPAAWWGANKLERRDELENQ